MNMPDVIRTLRARGHDAMTIHKVAYENPLRFMSQSKRFNFEMPIPLRAEEV